MEAETQKRRRLSKSNDSRLHGGAFQIALAMRAVILDKSWKRKISRLGLEVNYP